MMWFLQWMEKLNKTDQRRLAWTIFLSTALVNAFFFNDRLFLFGLWMIVISLACSFGRLRRTWCNCIRHSCWKENISSMEGSSELYTYICIGSRYINNVILIRVWKHRRISLTSCLFVRSAIFVGIFTFFVYCIACRIEFSFFRRDCRSRSRWGHSICLQSISSNEWKFWMNFLSIHIYRERVEKETHIWHVSIRVLLIDVVRMELRELFWWKNTQKRRKNLEHKLFNREYWMPRKRETCVLFKTLWTHTVFLQLKIRVNPWRPNHHSGKSAFTLFIRPKGRTEAEKVIGKKKLNALWKLFNTRAISRCIQDTW